MGTVRVYVDGVWDMFHYGHVKLFEYVKTHMKTANNNVYLIVGVTGDADTAARKGLTVQTHAQRCEMVGQCKWVDAIVPDCPWVVDAAFIGTHDLRWVVHDGAPYQSEGQEDVYAYVKSIGRFQHVSRTSGVSTTDLISKILSNYEEYVVRNLKRGCSRKELNLSWWEAFSVLTKNRLAAGSTHLLEDLERYVDGLPPFAPSRHHIPALYAGCAAAAVSCAALLWRAWRV